MTNPPLLTTKKTKKWFIIMGCIVCIMFGVLVAKFINLYFSEESTSPFKNLTNQCLEYSIDGPYEKAIEYFKHAQKSLKEKYGIIYSSNKNIKKDDSEKTP